MSVRQLQRCVEAHAGRRLAGASVAFEHVMSEAWASATFRGERHEFSLRIDGADFSAAHGFAASLGELEVPMAGALLADLVVREARNEGASVRFALEALTVDD